MLSKNSVEFCQMASVPFQYFLNKSLDQNHQIQQESDEFAITSLTLKIH